MGFGHGAFGASRLFGSGLVLRVCLLPSRPPPVCVLGWGAFEVKIGS